MTALARALQLHEDRWRWLEDRATPLGAAAVVLSSYLVFAFDRFGWPDFAVRPTVRLMLTGFYGWVWLALASWLVGRAGFGSRGPLSASLRLTGHAHLPLLLIAVVIQVVPVMAGVSNVAIWPAAFTGLFWFPALLVQGTAAASGFSLRRAAYTVAAPYLVWAAVVGRLLWRQLGHLL